MKKKNFIIHPLAILPVILFSFQNWFLKLYQHAINAFYGYFHFEQKFENLI